MELNELAEAVITKLHYRDFTKGELLKALNGLNIELNDDILEQLISKLQELGFSYEEGFTDFNYESIPKADFDTNIDKSLKEYKNSGYDYLGIRGNGIYSNDELLKSLVLDIIKKLSKSGLNVDNETVYKFIKDIFKNKPSFYELARSINHTDQLKLLNTLCDYYLANQNYLISLVNVKATDARLTDLASSFQAKESTQDVQDAFSDKYPEANFIENQVKVQDVNNTLATAALNMAMEELGQNADPEVLKNRSLEILEEEKSSGKGSM